MGGVVHVLETVLLSLRNFCTPVLILSSSSFVIMMVFSVLTSFARSSAHVLQPSSTLSFLSSLRRSSGTFLMRIVAM